MILVDTGYWLALANARDRYHARTKDVACNVREPLVTTWPVLTEACHLLPRVHPDAPARLLSFIGAGGAEVFSLASEHLPRILELMKKYETLPMDLADASLVIAAETLGSGRIFSTDQRDFGAYRWKNRKPFTNLLLP